MANYHVSKHSKLIQQMRKKHNLTQEFLASKIGISRPTYVQIEQGGKDLTISAAKTLADIFGISFDDFLAGKEPNHEVILETASADKKANSDLRIRIMQKNLDKFKQVLLYILETVGAKPNVGETVLHKLLYFIDFDYYEKFEENLMGATYIKNHHGPTSVELCTILKDMQRNGEIEAGNSKHFTIITKNDRCTVVKARLFCRYLKGSSLRIIYAFHCNNLRVDFIGIYFKGDKENENCERIKA